MLIHAVLSENKFRPSTSGINTEFKETSFAGRTYDTLFPLFPPNVCRDVSGCHEVALSQRECLLRAELSLVFVFTTLKLLNITPHFLNVSLFGTIFSMALPAVQGYTHLPSEAVCSNAKQRNCEKLPLYVKCAHTSIFTFVPV